MIPFEAFSHWIQCSTHIIGRERGKKQMAQAEHTIASAFDIWGLVLNGCLELIFLAT